MIEVGVKENEICCHHIQRHEIIGNGIQTPSDGWWRQRGSNSFRNNSSAALYPDVQEDGILLILWNSGSTKELFATCSFGLLHRPSYIVMEERTASLLLRFDWHLTSSIWAWISRKYLRDFKFPDGTNHRLNIKWKSKLVKRLLNGFSQQPLVGNFSADYFQNPLS